MLKEFLSGMLPGKVEEILLHLGKRVKALEEEAETRPAKAETRSAKAEIVPVKDLPSSPYVLNYLDENTGMTVITGDCPICHQFPCPHINTKTWSVKSKAIKEKE